ncbi:DNA-binding response regulator, AraC family [Labilithrix luteola]|uniref:DNA-binding response regulator, AraC family n=1 Tax=Labilithrix luteola TaxID=1391654 RepID=A0A0K1QFT5_9BACT|nr:response regulator [Labilithrix luteola]AKV04522.1 DNA-binding response regulator, AraC family [Labilithrix luteola]
MSHRATVLVVDDDEDTVETMRDILREEGHVVLCARNGREALELVSEKRPDLVLLDLNMPEMDGRSFLETIRNDPALANTHVVVLSGAPDAPRFSCESVSKPLRLDTLLALLERVADAGKAPLPVSTTRIGGDPSD